MSRLNTYQQKQFKKKVIFYLFLIGALVFFMFTIGFRMLIGASYFLANLTSNKKVAPLEKKELFYGTLNVDTIPQATNSAQIIISGTVTNYDLVEFYLNDKKVKESSISATDSFTEEIGDLEPGDNEVYLKAIAKQAKQEKETQTYEIIYKNEKPKLEISEPSSPQTVKKPELKIAGSTDSEVFIKVNELPLVVGSDGNFQTTIRLQEGENSIVITAEDDAGNIETKTLLITYQKDD